MTHENGSAQGLPMGSSHLSADEIKQAATQPGASAEDNLGVRTLATNKLPDSLNDGFQTRDGLSEDTDGKRPSSPDEVKSHQGSSVAETRSTITKDTESLASEPVVQQLMRKINQAANGNDGPKTSANYCNFPSGFQQRNYYEHSKKLTDFVDVTYNPRTRQFIFLDTRGVTTWDKDGIEHTVSRSLSFPKYVNKFLRNIIYARKYNVYFCLAKDFSLKVLNKDFYETCNVASDLSSVMFLIFNPVKDELITGGVKGTKVWEFKQVTDQVWTEIKPMANYGLFLKRELTGIKGGWIRKVELELQLQHLYCCSDTDILCYNMEGKPLFRLNNAHKSQINGCKYSPQARMLITCSNDNDVKVWSMTGGHVHTFRGHSRSVTGIVLHPETSTLVLTSSMDGSVRMWSLDIMELMYTLVISTDGIEWMGLTGEKYLWTATHHDLGVWHLNHVVQFHALARCRINSLQIAGCEGKTTRLVAVGEDSSVRLVSMKDQKSLSTVLPPPSISPLQQVLGVTYNRECSMVYLLISEEEIWVYTMRTDPACRTAVWDLNRLQDKINTRGPSALSRNGSAGASTSPRHRPASRGPASSQLGYTFPTHRATLQGRGLHQTTSPCTSIATVTSHVMYWAEEGFVCPLNDNFLVLGLKDGRILFMDPMLFGHRYCELQASKDSIFDMVFDKAHSTLIAKSHLRDNDVFQFWSLPGLELQHLVDVPRDVTGYSRLGSVFLTGHSDGSLILHHLKPVTSSMVYSIPDEGVVVKDRQRDHVAPIVAVDSCCGLQIFVSCSSDGAVKVWDTEKSLMTEIALEEPISAARFINSKGDLMLGYMNHLFFITHTKVLPTSAKTQFPEENFETESEIYEDPAVRYEGAAANPDPLDMEGYLVPFNLDYNERFRGGRSSLTASNASSDKSDEEDSDGDFSMAPTEMYISPSITPRRLSTVDLLTSGKDVSKEEMRSKVQALSLIKKRRSRSSKLNLIQREDVPLDFDMPQFGTSPGPSPTPSPPSSRSEYDVSEDESEAEDESDEDAEAMEEEADVKLTNKISLMEMQELQKKESKEIKAGVIRLSDLKQPDEEVSKYSMSKMKIDAKSLLKRVPVTIPKPLKLDRTSQPLMATVAEIKSTQDNLQKSSGQPRMKTPVKKKAKKGERVRVGDRAAAAAAAKAKLSAAERQAEVSATSLSQAEPSRTAASKLTVSVDGGVTSKRSVVSSTSSASTPSPQTSDPSLKSKPNVAVPALPVVQKDSKSLSSEKKPAKPGEKQTKQKVTGKGSKKSILDDWKKPKAPQSASSETQADASDEETMRAASAGTRDSERPVSSTHGADVATDIGEGITAMYKAASRMAIANKYNPLRAKSPGATTTTPSHTDRGTESDDNPQELTSDDPGDDGVMRDSDSSPMSRPNSSPFDSRLQSASSYHSTHSQRDRDSVTPNYNSGRRSQVNSPYDISGNDQGIIVDTPSRYQSQTPQSLVTPSPKPTATPLHRPSKPSMSLPPRPTRPVDRDRAPRETRGEERQRENEIHIPTAVADDKIPFSTEMEGRLARPNTAEGRSSLQRPHTAAANLHVNFESDVLFDGHDTPIPRYLSCPGSPADFKALYRNDGLHFEDNWQEKMIVRHQILKQQKEQRAQSAADRRRLLELRKRQRRKALLGHHHCASDAAVDASPQEVYVTRSDTSLHMMRKRCQSAPTGRVVPSSPPVQPRQAFGQQKEPDLSSERPYRFRLNRSAPPKPRIPTEDFFEEPGSILVKRPQSTKSIPSKTRFQTEEVYDDAELYYQSQPGSLIVKRPHSSNSIPSKTRRYVLVTKIQGDPETPLPTSLERQLLAERFPQTRHRLQMHPQEPHKSSPSMELVNISCVGEGPFS